MKTSHRELISYYSNDIPWIAHPEKGQGSQEELSFQTGSPESAKGQ